MERVHRANEISEYVEEKNKVKRQHCRRAGSGKRVSRERCVRMLDSIERGTEKVTRTLLSSRSRRERCIIKTNEDDRTLWMRHAVVAYQVLNYKSRWKAEFLRFAFLAIVRSPVRPDFHGKPAICMDSTRTRLGNFVNIETRDREV